MGDIPSGPAAFVGHIYCRAFQTSSTLNTARNSSFMSVVTWVEIEFILASKLDGLSDICALVLRRVKAVESLAGPCKRWCDLP